MTCFWVKRREEGSGWGTHVYLWQIHFDIWQNQYNIVKLNKIKLKKSVLISLDPFYSHKLVAQTVKILPAMWETGARGWEDPLEKGTATLSTILAWRILWTEEPGWLQSMGLQRVGHD